VLQFLGGSFKYVDASSATGSLTMPIPGNSPTGNLILLVQEGSTGASVYVIVHVGPVNPLVANVGGVPLFDILITLLFVVLLLAVILLWRRTGLGRAPSGPATGKPSTPPPPPPSGPSQQAAGPMSVACKHCGASIEITTSKRPIEVMCPSCGETQVVQ
jgi:DNA-directed RNA polymerase subunit RPC12/RpoP